MRQIANLFQPIPLELLMIKEMDEVIPQGAVKRTSSSLLPSIRNNASADKKGEGWPITFRHLGKAGYDITLYAANQAARQKWLEFIDTAQQRLRSRADFLNTLVISSGFFSATNKVNCLAPFGTFYFPFCSAAIAGVLTVGRWWTQAGLRHG
jgi:RHO1 GDP-GTP exchange protein 1/2